MFLRRILYHLSECRRRGEVRLSYFLLNFSTIPFSQVLPFPPPEMKNIYFSLAQQFVKCVFQPTTKFDELYWIENKIFQMHGSRQTSVWVVDIWRSASCMAAPISGKDKISLDILTSAPSPKTSIRQNVSFLWTDYITLHFYCHITWLPF